jgi:membrane-bound ClpP family serine protease
MDVYASTPHALVSEVLQRMPLTSRRAIQGVGCRLLLYRLARTLGLTGWVRHQGAYRQVGGAPASEGQRRGRAGRWRLAVRGLLVMFIVRVPPSAQTVRPVVYVVPIGGIIDLGLAPFVQRVLDEAAAAAAAAVILEINTFGGRVEAAVLIRDALLQARVRTVVFINKRTISTAALFSLAGEKIAMAAGGTICAATPVAVGQANVPAQPEEEKTVSYMRKEFRSTAEARKRPPLLAEAMVDADVDIPG